MLRNEFALPLIVTQPDAFGGRNLKTLIVPPVKTFALENDIEVLQPENLKAPSFIEKLTNLSPTLGVVISYGKLIPGSVFKIPRHRMINVHFSMLPRYRGAAPVQRGIENGDTSTGITIFELVKKMDAGPIWARKEYPILPDDTTETVWKRLSIEGKDFLLETMTGIFNGTLGKYPQDESKATYAPPVRAEESFILWEQTAQEIYNKFRAFTPWPGLCCSAGEKRLKLTTMKVSSLTHTKNPGDVLSMDKKKLLVCCGQGTVLEVTGLQPPGKKSMTPYCYCLGNQLPPTFS
jgi:methionyl-tRNA formyltransferase